MPDLPDISQNLDDPLPQVDPNSQLVPYRTASTQPGGQPVVTTGYGPRGRPPVQMPDSFGGGFPDLNQIATSAFSKLPVDEAIKAVEAATRYQGQRGYQRDLQSGMNAAQAFAKWGPMLFRQATGIPEAIDRSVPTPISPQQLIQNRLRQQQLENEQKATQARIDAAKVMTPYQSAEIDLRRQALNKPPKPIAAKVATITVPIDPEHPEGAKITGPANDPDVQKAVKKHEEFNAPKAVPEEKGLLEKAKEFLGGSTATPPDRVKVTGPGGKKGTVPKGSKLPEGWKLTE